MAAYTVGTLHVAADSMSDTLLGVDMTSVIEASEVRCDYTKPIGSGGFAQVGEVTRPFECREAALLTIVVVVVL